ncbi:MAG: hypothetical protein AAGM84_17955 [Pseudomonadota bacterium]
MKRTVAAVFACCAASLGHAESPAVLRAQIEAAGTHVRPGIERHTVEIDACVMTTFWWRSDVPDTREVLWSSFRFDMSVTTIVQPNKGGPSVAVEGGSEDGGDFMIMFFEAPKFALARHERHVLRPPSRGTGIEASPRGDGTTHYFQTSDSFFFRHEGAGVIEKATRFVDTYTRYVEANCRLSG